MAKLFGTVILKSGCLHWSQDSRWGYDNGLKTLIPTLLQISMSGKFNLITKLSWPVTAAGLRKVPKAYERKKACKGQNEIKGAYLSAKMK